jgi:hypothetical protein
MAAVNPSAEHQPRTRCWYSRRSPHLPADLASQTVEDGLLVYCAHPMMMPVVGYHFDIRNCDGCDYYRPVRAHHPRYPR